MKTPPETCWCGKPLHYEDLHVEQRLKEIIERFGEFINVRTDDGGIYRVQRHYIALHGIKEKDLAKLGFEVVNGRN